VTAKKKLRPGIYPGVPFDEYASWPAVNHSKLLGFKHTPAHARDLFLNEKPPTKATQFGWLSHLAILEPSRLWEEAAVRPDVDGRTKEGRPILQKWKDENKGKIVVTEEEREKLETMVARVRAHETAREYIEGPGQNEVSICWIDEETKIPCKGRIDRLAAVSRMPGIQPEYVPQGDQFMVVIDVKTLGDVATPRNVERSIYNYDYASAAAMYLDGLQQVAPTKEDRPFVWLVVETDSPHLVRLFTPNPDLLEWGYQRYRKWLRQYAECHRTNNWPGWDPGIEEANLPPWAAKVWEMSQ
jgi:hypothetical protein